MASEWMSEPLAFWITQRQLFSATIDGCTAGVKAKDDQPARKPWRFVTNNVRLAESLGKLECTHDRRAPLQRKYTRNSAFYPDPLCRLMLSALFPQVINGQVPTMPRMLRVNHKHRQHAVKGMPCVPIGVMMYESGLKQRVFHAHIRAQAA